MAEVVEGAVDGVGVVVEVADEDDEAAAFEAVGQAVEGGAEVGFAAGLDGFELFHHLVEVARGAAGGHVEADVGVEGGEADGVLLAGHEVGQDGGQVGAVLEL